MDEKERSPEEEATHHIVRFVSVAVLFCLNVFDIVSVCPGFSFRFVNIVNRFLLKLNTTCFDRSDFVMFVFVIIY